MDARAPDPGLFGRLKPMREPAAGLVVVGVLLSALLHFPVYETLGFLAKRLAESDARAREGAVDTTSEIELVVEAEEPAPPVPAAPVDDAPRIAHPQPVVPQPTRPVVPPPPAPEQPEEEEAVVATPTPPAPAENLHAIRQQAQNDEAPEDPQYLAEHANRVDEETVARLRSYVEDAADPSAGATHESEEPEAGNDDAQEVADVRDAEGSDERAPTPDEAHAERPEHAPDTPLPTGPTPRETIAAVSETPSPGERGHVEREQGREAAGQEAEDAAEEMLVTDAAGSFTIRRPRPAREAIAAEQGDGGVARRTRRGSAGTDGRRLELSWSQFERAFGAEQLAAEREARIEERRSRQRGTSHQERWEEFRAAIENFTSNVRPGDQTALNAAASPFATYISDLHRRIHRQFADRFIARLPTFSTSPLADETLFTKLEIILNRDGSVHRIGVVETSGLLPFDYGAYNAVMRGQPYPEAPTSILSGDGRVYLRWGFFRNPRMCHVANAEPYILPHPPGTPRDLGGPHDRPEDGTVIPRGAQPTWGTPPAGGSEDGEQGRAPIRSPGPAPAIAATRGDRR